MREMRDERDEKRMEGVALTSKASKAFLFHLVLQLLRNSLRHPKIRLGLPQVTAVDLIALLH